MTLTVGHDTVVAAFPTAAAADRAIAEALALGLVRTHIGRLDDGGHGPVLVTMTLDDARRSAALEALRRLGADPLLDATEAGERFRRIPHPGVDDRNGVKLPFGPEYPDPAAPAPPPPRAPHRTLDQELRARTFDEIDLGFSPDQALVEADRCIRCPEPPCQVACPAGNDIPTFIDGIARGALADSFAVLQRTNAFSAICGRVCDVDRQCESACVLREGGGEAVQIGRLERFVADTVRSSQEAPTALPPAASGPRVAIVGAGPAGLAAAGDLADAGCRVEVIDALPVVGGAVAWGIPTFRLPPEVLAREVRVLEQRGVTFRLGTELGKHVAFDDLVTANEAVIVALGAQGSVAASVPGRELAGVWQAKDLLAAAKLGRLGVAGSTVPLTGPRSIVIGGGNTALDAAQTLLRLRHNGTLPEVTIAYRRGEGDMPARHDEIESARSEGVQFRSWAAPVAILAGEDGGARGVRFIETKAIRPRDGRRSAIVTVPGSEFELEAETIVFALGYRAVLPTLSGLRIAKSGLLGADARAGRTARSKVWAVGDVVTGPNTVVHAMAAGRRTARDILRSLKWRAA